MISIADMVDVEVRCCASYLIPELVKSDSSGDLMSICRQDDYRSAAEDEGWRLMNRDNGISVIVNGDQIYDPGNDCVEAIGDVRDYADYEVDDPDDQAVWQALCESEGIEPYVAEAVEHWVVSYWLAKQLERYGEMVSDIYGVTVWGRTITGQAIVADGVIQRIYQDLCNAD